MLSANKPGQCPFVPVGFEREVEVADLPPPPPCNDDTDCPDDLKCCNAKTGPGKICRKPVFPGVLSRLTNLAASSVFDTVFAVEFGLKKKSSLLLKSGSF